MNQPPRGPGRPYDPPYRNLVAGQVGAGSVRRARERMEANGVGYSSGPPRGVPQVADPPQNPNFPPPSQSRGHMSGVPPSQPPRVANRSRPNPSATRPIISNPTPTSWPLPEEPVVRKRNNSPHRATGSGNPPRRPPRPDYVPSILMQQQNLPIQHYEQQQMPPRQQPYHNQRPYWQDNYSLSPNQDRQPTNWAPNPSSRLSTSSSFASVPDLPVPVPVLPAHSPTQQMPRRIPVSLGPPPSSRKGASSYYSQSSFVSPIPEDPEPRGTSYASSHVMPTSWGDGPPEYYMGNGMGDDEDEDRFDGDDGRQFRGGDHDENSSLVRKASLGKRHKPALTTIKSDDSVQGRGLNNVNVPRSKSVLESSGLGGDVMVGATAGAFAAGLSSPNPSEDIMSPTNSFSGGTALLDPSSSNVSSDRTGTEISNLSNSSNPKAQPSPAVDPRVREIMGGLQKGGALQQGTPEPVTSPLAGGSTRRPPPLNMNAVKDAEVRGSLTSLPDLIKRATRVASNLDKGRTASRLGMLDMLGPGSPHPQNRSPLSQQGSLTDMLGSFPPPGAGTPTTDRPHSRWPSPFANSRAAMNRGNSMDSRPPTYSSEKPKPRRRCCGLPIWAFVLLLLVLLLLAAAAVVIPIILIVIPRSDNNTTQGAVSIASCRSTQPCANGGSILVVGNHCGCICVNGFTGSTCTQPPTSDCSTADFPNDTLRKVTLGTNVSSVITTSQSSFGIPLNATTILSSFAASNFSCAFENNLVTFNLPGSNSYSNNRRDFHAEKIDIVRPLVPALLSPHNVQQRNAESSPQPTPPAAFANDAIPSAAAVTSNGILIAASADGGNTPYPTIAKGTGTFAPTSTSVATSTPSTTATANAPSTKDLGFSKVAILKVIEVNGVTAGQQAQMLLQTMFLGGSFKGGKVEVGNGVTFDFTTDAIVLGNGQTVGGQAT